MIKEREENEIIHLNDATVVQQIHQLQIEVSGVWVKLRDKIYRRPTKQDSP